MREGTVLWDRAQEWLALVVAVEPGVVRVVTTCAHGPHGYTLTDPEIKQALASGRFVEVGRIPESMV